MRIRVKHLAVRVNFLQPGLGQGGFKLLRHHDNSRLQGGGGGRSAFGIGRQGHFKGIKHREQFRKQTFIGKSDRLLALASGAFLEILQIGCLPQKAVPIFIGFGRFFLKLFDILGRQRHGSGRLGFFRRHGLFLVALVFDFT